MKNTLAPGISMIHEIVGEGPEAQAGARVTYNARFFLRRGDEVTRDAEIISRARGSLTTRSIAGVELIEHVTVLGKRQAVAGVERALRGMRANGYREVLVAPHLAYGEQGVPGLIPANAILRIQLWVRHVAAPA